jgi:hypothetical protein
MSKPDIPARAARIADEKQREHFLLLMSEAGRYSGIAREVRASAWSFFRKVATPRRRAAIGGKE